MEAQHFVRTPSYFVKAADASGKTKAINPTCAAVQEKMKRYLPDYRFIGRIPSLLIRGKVL
jgi:hypothetical protein